MNEKLTGAAEASLHDHIRSMLNGMKRGARIQLSDIPDDTTFLSSSFPGHISKAMADVIQAALTPDPAVNVGALVPEGWQLVPMEPTREMWAAMADTLYGYKNRHHDKVAGDLFYAMLAAAPTPPQAGTEGERPALQADVVPAPLNVRRDVEVLAIRSMECEATVRWSPLQNGHAPINVGDVLTLTPQPNVAPVIAEMISTAKDAYSWAREWSGSAFIAGEKLPPEAMSEDECKAELYRGLCKIGNHMDWLSDALAGLNPPLTPAPQPKPLPPSPPQLSDKDGGGGK